MRNVYWRAAAIGLGVGLGLVSGLAFRLGAAVEENGASRVASAMPAAGPRATPTPDPWLDEMVDWYYPAKNSEQWEELFVRDFFRDRRRGFFLDVGCSEYRTASTTYYLDRHLGWRGLAIDALPDYAADYARFRPRSRYLQFYVGDKSDEEVAFYRVRGALRKSTSSKLAVAWAAHDRLTSEETHVHTITLDDLLARERVERIDFLSMDIELAEPAALAGFDIERYRPALALVEMHPPVRAQIEGYFARHGYVAIEEYGRRDARNGYFVPRAIYAEWTRRAAPWETR